jgi:uroporphyrinogen-III synthase
VLGQPLKRILYLGLEPPPEKPGEMIYHLPLIRVVARSAQELAIKQLFAGMSSYTHGIFTSKQAVRFFFKFLEIHGYELANVQRIKMCAVGKATARELEGYGASLFRVAFEETAEGVCDVLADERLPCHSFFWPHAALARDVISRFFRESPAHFYECVLYDTHYVQPESPPRLENFDEIVFSSPSTVEGFRRVYGRVPAGINVVAKGPVTAGQLFLLHDSLPLERMGLK